MAITTAMSTSFKSELMQALHNFLLSGGNTFKLALFVSAATLGASTTAYSTTNEATGTNYTAGGANLTRIDPTTSGTTAYTDFADLTFSTVTITAAGCLIYNSTNSNRAGSAHSFGTHALPCLAARVIGARALPVGLLEPVALGAHGPGQVEQGTIRHPSP